MRSTLIVLLVLVSLLASIILAQDCQDSDYEGQYTQCRPDDTHDLVYYLKRTSNCTGGVYPPAPVFDLPCNITCGSGEYLPLGSLVCSPCSPGTFTRGGGVSVNEWNSWPTNMGVFSTYCVNNLVANSPPINCSGWVLTGGTVRSGVITDVQSSILVLQTQLIVAGVVRFTYRVDAEPGWDGLIFYVDGIIVLPKVSVTYVYVEFTADVTAGYHTFKWEYYKDRSISRGEDAAFITMIEIVGLTYAEPSCTPCEQGTYTSSSSSIQCSPCPLNTYANSEGTASCTPCPSNQFAYTGASACLPKVPCTTSDYQVLYGPCTSGNTRLATASWLQPHLCDDSILGLPASTVVPCAPCPPGTSQDASFNCVTCPTGTYSAGSGAPCVQCGAGHAAPKIFSFNSFDSWPAGVTTSCTGYCGTNGWRLRSSFIDSGAGHGETVDSSFSIPVTLEQPGYVTFSFVLACSRFCALYYLDYPFDASIQWNTSSVANNTLLTYTTPIALEVGTHNLTWTFESEPYDPAPNSYKDAARIYSIVINGTSVGGASTCTACVAGSVATAGSSLCTNCTAGLSSDPTLSQCVTCAGNTFSPYVGGQCYNCGNTTLANTNHTDCNDNCTFMINGDTYDLRPLAGLPIGPVYDGFEYYYYINLCGRGNFIPDCHDIDDVPLNTHVCQILPYGYSLDVGWSTGYYAIPPSVGAKGFRVHYDLGTLGCGPKNNGVSFPRNSDLTFICDPSAGIGILQGVGGVEDTPCHYSFQWSSLYACPICTTSDYTYYYSPCGANGMRTKNYYWKDPVLCHDGVKLPATEQVSCSDSTVFCGIGQQLSEDGSSCIACPAGEYSVGGGILISSWEVGNGAALPYGYYTSCTGACTNWVSDDAISIHSGFGDSSLYGSHSFRIAGSITFNYKVFAPSDGVFTFVVDGVAQLVVQQVTVVDWTQVTVNVSAGSHIFQWSFTNGIRYSPSLLTFQTVSIYNIFVQGLDYHADSCLPCPDGTFSSSDPSVIGCLPCPADTFNTAQTSQCAPCPSNQYSLPGASYCLNRTWCTAESYYPEYTDCINGTRNVFYPYLIPITCSGGSFPPPTQTGLPCAPCPPFTVPSGSACISCAAGQYFDDGQCVDNIPGFIVQYSQYYFFDNSTTQTWPASFFTGCSGVCGNDGWRLLGDSIDSGFHSTNAVDSYVGLTANFVFDGQVTFTYALDTTEQLDGLQFAIDGAVASIAVPQNQSQSVTVTVQVPSGTHKLLWNYHQESAAGSATVSNIVLQGVQGGTSAAASVPCEPGLFATDPKAVNCSVCGPGTYSSVAGSSACAQCPVNTYNPNSGANECRQCDLGSSSAVEGSVQCNTTCAFTIGNDAYSLTSLGGPVTVYDDARRQYVINVCQNVGTARCPNSHACIIGVDGTVTEAGNSFKFIPDPDNSSAAPFSIAFEHGDLCPGTSFERSTVIEFECEIDSPSASPAFLEQDANCVTTFSWRTNYACRICTDSDYATVTGACSGGHRKVSQTRISACNGASSISVRDESCSGQEFPLAAIIVIVLVFVAVVAVAAFIFFRNRRLAAQYASLIEETRSTNISM